MSMLAFLLTSLISLPAMAEGTSIRGGGDELALDFAITLRAAVAEVRERFPTWGTELDLAGLEAAPDRTTIFVTSAALVVPAGGGEQESVAANDPSSRTIWINRSRWEGISNGRIRRAIALHEFLSLEKIEGTGRYPYSLRFLAGGEATLLSGQEAPSPANWQHLRFRCNTRGKFAKPSGGTLSSLGGSIAVQSSWRIAGRVFELRYALLAYDKGEEGAPKFPMPRFEQSYRATESDRADGTVYEARRRTLGGTPASESTALFERSSSAALLFEERLSTEATRTWSWEAGRKRSALWQTRTRRRPDGSREITQDWLNASSLASRGQISEQRVCSEDLTEGEWLSSAARAEIGPWIETLTELSSRANVAAAQLAACNPENCAARETRAEGALAAFEATWDDLYRAMEAKLETRAP